MNNTLEQHRIRFKLPVRILSGVALLLATIVYIFSSFTSYVSHNGGPWELIFGFDFWLFLEAILSVIPFALIFIITYFLYSKKESKILLILALAFKFLVPGIFSFVVRYVIYSYPITILLTLPNLIALVLNGVFFVWLVLCVQENFLNKIDLIISCVVPIIFSIISEILYQFWMLEPMLPATYYILQIFSTLTRFLFLVIILLYGLDTGKPKHFNTLTPEQALRNLNIQYEQGTISYEDYQQKRMEIIKML